MRISTVILPVHRWPTAQEHWRRAEELGLHAAYTFDHLAFRSFRSGPWLGAVPTLAAAAAVTSRIRLGTLVASPNFRHPVTLAQELMSLDDISGGRVTAGIGAGGEGYDTTILGQRPWTPRERADRFDEFVPLLDRLLTRPATTSRGTHYAAVEAPMIPGCVQRPRMPFTIAATGPRGLALAARYGQGWVTFGDRRQAAGQSGDAAAAAVRDQVTRLGEACAALGRDPGDLEKVLMTGFTKDPWQASVDAFVDLAGRYSCLGITEIVLPRPVPGTMFDGSEAAFEKIVTEGRGQLAD
ncbi:LLM class flavin-dependent oxidoreductase [Streptomyces caatingaensis]|uniref:Luciferase n=1 Tax=Streptomyces caatingaensis TaxID=1678637 RepID=A0A0K9XBM6_9ACTN|nr:LLM class flavin-dependent oxidoreductase [Streptomyces caatingaensis]KNB50804.1 luciferase [Streptomyces caatingaensis]